jgi:hypothetical protein
MRLEEDRRLSISAAAVLSSLHRACLAIYTAELFVFSDWLLFFKRKCLCNLPVPCARTRSVGMLTTADPNSRITWDQSLGTAGYYKPCIRQTAVSLPKCHFSLCTKYNDYCSACNCRMNVLCFRNRVLDVFVASKSCGTSLTLLRKSGVHSHVSVFLFLSNFPIIWLLPIASLGCAPITGNSIVIFATS